MNHLKAISIKALFTTIILFSILPIFDTASFSEILFISLLVTGATYIIGDLFILKRYGNFFGTIADFWFSFIAIWLLASIFIEGAYPIITASLFAAFFIAISEGLFHIYMLERVLEQERNEEFYRRRGLLTTEISAETHVDKQEAEK